MVSNPHCEGRGELSYDEVWSVNVKHGVVSFGMAKLSFVRVGVWYGMLRWGSFWLGEFGYVRARFGMATPSLVTGAARQG